MNKKVKEMIKKADEAPLWIGGFLLIAIVFLPYVILGEKSVFPIHDQLDETFLSYVLNARHLWDGSDRFDEIMCGLNKSGLQPSAPLFVLLYCIFPAFVAFVLQYALVFCVAFFGMYACVRELTGSSILSFAAAGCFSMLPYQPVYGTSIVGVPMILTAFLFLRDKKKIGRCYVGILFFTVTSHLVLIGYVVLGYWMLYLLYSVISQKKNKHVYGGFAALLGGYIVINYRLVLDLLVKSNFISHREEFVNAYSGFWETVYTVFTGELGLHAVSLHTWLILPIFIGIIVGGIGFSFLSEESKRLYQYAFMGMLFLIGTALGYAFFNSYLFASWQNRQTGILHYFDFERIIWVYPAGWILEAGALLGVWWHAFEHKEMARCGWVQGYPVRMIVLAVVFVPTAIVILARSYFYMNISQYNNGSEITGYITWESYFAEDLMEQLEGVTGRRDQYRIVHLGINPTPSLVHGFYTVDGYSNNYSLEYKHTFRRIIGGELEKIEECRVYFDTWGSRCYLFNHLTGNYMLMRKGNSGTYEDLSFDWNTLKELNCKYLFSGSEIIDAEQAGLKYLGYYDTDNSYWGVWLYEIL